MNTNIHEFKNNDLVYQVIGCAMEVINELGHGLREKTYEKALIVEFKRNNILFSQQKIYRVYPNVSKVEDTAGPRHQGSSCSRLPQGLDNVGRRSRFSGEMRCHRLS